MDTGLIFLGTEQAVEHVPGRPEHVLDGDPLTNVWRNVVHPSGKMHAGVWDCRAGAFELPCHASTELCVITEGSAGSAGGTAVSIAGAVLDSSYNR